MELDACLESLQVFDKVIVVNGKWNDFEGINPLSTEQARNTIDSFPNTMRIDSPNMPEWHNRNLCVRAAASLCYDKIIYIDTDEFVELKGTVKEYEESLNLGEKKSFQVNYYDVGRGGHCKMTRGLTDLDKISIEKQHNRWIYGDKNVFRDPAPPTESLLVITDKSYRTKSRQERMKRRNRENPIH